MRYYKILLDDVWHSWMMFDDNMYWLPLAQVDESEEFIGNPSQFNHFFSEGNLWDAIPTTFRMSKLHRNYQRSTHPTMSTVNPVEMQSSVDVRAIFIPQVGELIQIYISNNRHRVCPTDPNPAVQHDRFMNHDEPIGFDLIGGSVKSNLIVSDGLKRHQQPAPCRDHSFKKNVKQVVKHRQYVKIWENMWQFEK